MKQTLVLNKKSALNSIIQEIETTGTSVQVFRGEKVVAKIVPILDQTVEEIGNYKTWGETLLSNPVEI